MNWESFFCGVFSVILLLIVVVSLGLVHIGSINTISGNVITGDLGNIPEECKVPTGQTLDSWIEHLGHHQETKYCLKYYK